ncbi:hypothetical protein GHK92_04855 [Nocardioides sp. dk4132]|uniref:hypothetical protein n=1 Tax=unclassified Nocardioides TaxID=2615069 RepID=UPI001296FF0A|nr:MULTISPECIES: hypothetical protein [unclassified Nocardioides]MQW75195.1 hypothetical protein [Nocardioides sp. dk4132]QGA07649.1 hypothetical protein GFH29_09750 [Nocardioides sp. dk884]
MTCTERRCALWAAARTASQYAGAGRARQLSWVVGEIHRARDLSGDEAPECEAWLAGEQARTYLTLAAAGALRSRGSGEHPSTAASMRVRSSVLRELSAVVGLEGPVPVVGTAPDRGWTDGVARRAFLTWLRHDTSESGARTWAAAALASAGLWVGEIASLTDRSVAPDGHVAGLMRNPPGPGAPYLLPLTLPGHVLEAVRAWLAVREQVVASERVRALFVTLRPGTRNGSVYARGLPLSSRSLNRSHAAAAQTWLRTGASSAHGLRAADLSLGRLAFSPETAEVSSGG